MTASFHSIPDLMSKYSVSEWVVKRIATNLEILQRFGRYSFVSTESLPLLEIGLKASGYPITPPPVDDSVTVPTELEEVPSEV